MIQRREMNALKGSQKNVHVFLIYGFCSLSIRVAPDPKQLLSTAACETQSADVAVPRGLTWDLHADVARHVAHR
ncbi:hypothetical protein Tco_1110409 [Tanacetum coccineum]|uniref:Uncharacterized protein n=1 Tax=Tanacetum coccineum TaxID=301880 RepID=A0ABQ5IIQ0_9ASTR